MGSLLLRTTTFRRIAMGVAVGALLLLSPSPVEAASPPPSVPTGAAVPARISLTCGSSVNPNTLSRPETITSTSIGRATVSLRDGHRGGRIYLWAAHHRRAPW
ncbi:hypothetical protein ACIGW8_27045 [Streptomyces sioyaensis]|uniref:hypothetical protein n=1 Tax=Streptomyces sioyaensis TaxID=67364 RepID=UPI0037D98E95